jgi:hypothetical protein
MKILCIQLEKGKCQSKEIESDLVPQAGSVIVFDEDSPCEFLVTCNEYIIQEGRLVSAVLHGKFV